MALVTIASLSQRAGRARDNVSAAASSSSSRRVHSTPARRSGKEDAMVLDAPDIQQDRPGARIAR
jgi:hypothetical protein